MQRITVLSITIDEEEQVICSKCGRAASHRDAVDAGWYVYVFHDRHECDRCRADIERRRCYELRTGS